MRFRKVSFALATLMLAGATGAEAAPITFDFTVTATAGPLSGQSSAGVFSFDDSIIPAGGGWVNGTDLLTALDFTWDGIAYTAATANTGGLMFDSAGNLINFLFGNHCGSSNCVIVSNQEQWFLTASAFDYTVAGEVGFWDNGRVAYSLASVTPTGIPEPLTLSLFGAGLVGAITLRQRRV